MSEIIFVATRTEADSAIAKFGYERLCSVPYEVWKNRSKTIVVTGIGLVNASLAFAWACENLKFDFALNIGAAGSTGLYPCLSDSPSSDSAKILTRVKSGLKLGAFYEISKVACLEPYNTDSYITASFGINLVSSSRPVSSAKDRAFAAKSAELVDMEAYALAAAAKLFSKELRIVKMLSDFSEACDIHDNIVRLSERMALLPQIWT